MAVSHLYIHVLSLPSLFTLLKSSPPPIDAVQGDQIVIHAWNGLGDKTVGTALHSHGMFFNGTNYYDGAVGITQCSIPSETGMDYHIDTSLQVSRKNPPQTDCDADHRPVLTGYTDIILVRKPAFA